MQRMPSPGVVLGLWVDIVLHRATRSTRKYPHTFWFGGVGPWTQRTLERIMMYHVYWYTRHEGDSESSMSCGRRIWCQRWRIGFGQDFLAMSEACLGWCSFGNRCSCSIEGIRIRCVCMLLYAHESIMHNISNFSIFHIFSILIIYGIHFEKYSIYKYIHIYI